MAAALPVLLVPATEAPVWELTVTLLPPACSLAVLVLSVSLVPTDVFTLSEFTSLVV